MPEPLTDGTLADVGRFMRHSSVPGCSPPDLAAAQLTAGVRVWVRAFDRPSTPKLADLAVTLEAFTVDEIKLLLPWELLEAQATNLYLPPAVDGLPPVLVRFAEQRVLGVIDGKHRLARWSCDRRRSQRYACWVLSEPFGQP